MLSVLRNEATPEAIVKAASSQSFGAASFASKMTLGQKRAKCLCPSL